MKLTSPGSFKECETVGQLPVAVSPAPGEKLIGWYENPPPWSRSLIVFSSQALYAVEGTQIDRIALCDILGYETPKSKAEIDGVRLVTKDGLKFVRICGSFGPYGNQKDAYSFIRVVRGLIAPKDLVVVEAGADGTRH